MSTPIRAALALIALTGLAAPALAQDRPRSATSEDPAAVDGVYAQIIAADAGLWIGACRMRDLRANGPWEALRDETRAIDAGRGEDGALIQRFEGQWGEDAYSQTDRIIDGERVSDIVLGGREIERRYRIVEAHYENPQSYWYEEAFDRPTPIGRVTIAHRWMRVGDGAVYTHRVRRPGDPGLTQINIACFYTRGAQGE